MEKKKKLNFDINKYKKYRDKIIYKIIDSEPENIIQASENEQYKRINSIKRIELSYNHMMPEVNKTSDDDLIILSDNDEIPNLSSPQFKKNKSEI